MNNGPSKLQIFFLCLDRFVVWKYDYNRICQNALKGFFIICTFLVVFFLNLGMYNVWKSF